MGGTGGTGGSGGAGGTGGSEAPVIDRIEVRCEGDRGVGCGELEAGETVQLVAAAYDADGAAIEELAFTWSSSDEAVLLVDEHGLVTAGGDGAASIRATAGGATGEVGFRVGILPVKKINASTGIGGDRPNVLVGQSVLVQAWAYSDPSGFQQNAQAELDFAFSNESAVEILEESREADGGETVLVRILAEGAITVTITSPQGEGVEAALVINGIPVTVGAPGASFSTLAAGASLVCGLESGAVSCWGENGAGQLGDGSTSFEPVPHPVAVAGGHSFAALTTGNDYACALDDGGSAWCWGSNFAGQLGIEEADGEIFDVAVPTLAAGGTAFTSIDAGIGHTCAVTPAGKAWCWGWNGNGQLGNGTSGEGRFGPQEIAGITFTSVQAGSFATCGLDTVGQAFCWGEAGAHLGAPADAEDPWAPVPTPQAVAGSVRFSTLTMGSGHVCGLTDAGAAHCWGANFSGAAGSAAPEVREPTPVVGGHNFVAIAAGGSHTCAIDDAGAAWCWGGNHAGQLGDGSYEGRGEPVQVLGGLSFSSITAGGETTCASATDGTAWCWGGSLSGQLGAGLVGTAWPLPIAVEAAAID
ncbi:Ig-like domain-containing protein [Vulgatibacter sp.]|uniref:Ig-like domain-containing protein n=1 Tax=Vulgatibacter sp. TaxID=1971226 RepID=UPI003567D64F